MSSAFLLDAFGHPHVRIDGQPLVGLAREPQLPGSLFAVGPSKASNFPQALLVFAAYVDERELAKATGVHALQVRVIPMDTFAEEYTPRVTVFDNVPVFDTADDPTFESRVLEGPDFRVAFMEAQPSGAHLSAAVPLVAAGVPITPVDAPTVASGRFSVGFNDGVDPSQERSLYLRSAVLRLRVEALVELLASFGRTERVSQYVLALFAADFMGNVSATEITLST